jgi:geranylgeranyl diphosphate synthase type II
MANVQSGPPDGGSEKPGTPATSSAGESTISPDWRAWFDEQRRRVDTEISNHLNALKPRLGPHCPLLPSVEYSLAAGGKRLRPVLVLETCHVCGGTDEAAWAAALAVECVHTFSLIHDDLPAMDDDDLRRGKPTSHKVFGEARAILAGDWLVAHAFELLASERVAPDVVAALVRTLAEGTQDMVVGQAADVAGEQRPTDPELVQFIHRHKTARLLEAACTMGALCGRASAEELKRMAGYGCHLGLAFQIVDDLLDRTGTAADLGKRVGKDADVSKQTYPAAFGLAESRRRARSEIEAAVAVLAPCGARADRLRDLAWYVLARDR